MSHKYGEDKSSNWYSYEHKRTKTDRQIIPLLNRS